MQVDRIFLCQVGSLLGNKYPTTSWAWLWEDIWLPLWVTNHIIGNGQPNGMRPVERWRPRGFNDDLPEKGSRGTEDGSPSDKSRATPSPALFAACLVERRELVGRSGASPPGDAARDNWKFGPSSLKAVLPFLDWAYREFLRVRHVKY